MNINKKIGLLLIAVILSPIIYGSFIDKYNESDITPINESERIPNDEYEVISHFIQQIKYPNGSKLVIQQQTVEKKFGYDAFIMLGNISTFEYYNKIKLDTAMVDDFKNKNAKTYKLENKFSIPQSVVLISNKELQNIFRDNMGWLRFYMKYPTSRGLIEIDRVGFNDNKTQALLQFGHQDDWLAGRSDLFFLTKDEGKWIIKANYIVWRS